MEREFDGRDFCLPTGRDFSPDLGKARVSEDDMRLNRAGDFGQPREPGTGLPYRIAAPLSGGGAVLADGISGPSTHGSSPGSAGSGRFDSRGNSWRRLGGLAAAALVLLGSGFFSGGCGVAPFNPKAEVRVTEVSPQVLSPYLLNNGGIVLPRARVSIASGNGVAMTIDGYRVDYYGPDGRKIESPALSVNGGLTSRVSAMGATAVDQPVTKVVLDIMTADAFRYVSAGTWTDTRDDISPIFARFTLYGKDTNDNSVSMDGSVTISATPNDPEYLLEALEVLKAEGLLTDPVISEMMTTEVRSWTD